LRWAIELARANRGQLLVLHVMTPPALAMPAEGYVSPALYESLESSARAQARKRLDAVVARARKAGARATGLLQEGVPHEVIARTARTQKADLLVIGTHGRGGLAKLFLGSVAARLVSTAPRPVLTVRGT
ncbi:MAG TPA: universal stress protein, partial [Methylomirabilota bacterium]